jgi:hypothetical protein
MKLSDEAAAEMRALALSADMRDDMNAVAARRHNPFVVDGIVNVDAWLECVQEFNEFINHEPRPFRLIIGEMRL